MEKVNKERKKIKKMLLELPMKMAKVSANTNCFWMGYEAKAPANLSKLKNKNEK